MTTAMTQELRDRLDGEVLGPGDDGYDAARSVWNAMIDRRPRLIVRCASTADVVLALRIARDTGLEVGVRCGGHNIAGLAVPEDGVMIDLTPMGGVRVDPRRRRARVQGGALLGALDAATQPYGLATTAGNVSHTGVGGLTLGGGMGWLARQYGLSCDNLESVELVTAAGAVLRANRTEHPELFWALRGGGGNFGVVTEFEFRLHDTGSRSMVAEYTFPPERAAAALRGWRDLNAEAPRAATFTASIGDGGVTTVGFVWVGDPAAGRRLLPAFGALGRPLAGTVTEQSYVDLQRREDSPQGHALRRYWKAHYLPALDDAAVEAIAGRGATDTGLGGAAAGGSARAGGVVDLLPAVSLQAYGGAIADVPDEETAFSHRQTRFEFIAAARWTDPAEDAERMAVARRCAAALDPYATGVYVNALDDEGAAGVRRAYPAAKLARLGAVKHTYDPDNVFRLNHNIAPVRP